MHEAAINKLGCAVWECAQAECEYSVDPTTKECMAIAEAVVKCLDIIIVPDNEEPREGDLFVSEEPTKINYTVGIPDIVCFDSSYHTVKYDDDGKMYVVTGGGTWLDMMRIIERDKRPVCYL